MMKLTVIVDDVERESRGVLYSLLNEVNPQPQARTKHALFALENDITSWNRQFLTNTEVLSVYQLDHINGDTVTDLFRRFIDKLDSNCRVFIDSLDQLELLTSSDTCFRIIRDFTLNDYIQEIVCTKHRDCSLISLKKFLHMANVRIHIQSITNSGQYTIHTEKKTSSGKITNIKEKLSYDGDKNIWQRSEIESKKEHSKTLEKKISTVLPHDVSSFKISLDESAQSIRKEIVPPYMEIGKGSIKIEYDEDNILMWDDEDPDEDLDI